MRSNCLNIISSDSNLVHSPALAPINHDVLNDRKGYLTGVFPIIHGRINDVWVSREGRNMFNLNVPPVPMATGIPMHSDVIHVAVLSITQVSPDCHGVTPKALDLPVVMTLVLWYYAIAEDSVTTENTYIDHTS